MTDWSVRTRSEDGTLRIFSNLKDAELAATKDKSIWKITFTIPSGDKVRLIRSGYQWVYQPIC